MKIKIFSLLMLLPVIFSFTACSKTNNGTSNNLESSVSSENNNSEFPKDNLAENVESALPTADNLHYNNQNSFVVKDENYLYFCSANSIYRENLSDGKREVIKHDDNSFYLKLMLLKNKLYFATAENLYQMNLDGTQEKYVFKLAEPLGKVYWTQCYVQDGNIYLYSDMEETLVKLVIDEKGNVQTEEMSKDIVTISNPRNMPYYFINPTQRASGSLTLETKENVIIENILNDKYVMISDDYIFYFKGESSDFVNNYTLIRTDLNAKESTSIKLPTSNIAFAQIDREWLYLINLDTNKYLRVNQTDLTVQELYGEYKGGTIREFCNGWLYSLFTIKPYRTNILTGVVEDLS